MFAASLWENLREAGGSTKLDNTRANEKEHKSAQRLERERVKETKRKKEKRLETQDKKKEHTACLGPAGKMTTVLLSSRI